VQIATPVLALSLLAGPAAAQKGETVRIAWIDPLSGLMAPRQNQVQQLPVPRRSTSTEQPGGREVRDRHVRQQAEPAETLNALKSAIDQGIRYIIAGQRLGVARRSIDAVNKHNERNPGKEVLYLNYAAVDPDLTNSKCSYWHFRFDADTSMKMEALTTFMKDQQDVKKVYLIDQNYAHGQQVAKYAKEIWRASGPTSQIVGEDLHPLAQVTRLRALRREDQGLGRRHRDHRQLGLRPDAAREGRERGRPQRQVLHLLRGVTRHADRARRRRRGRVFQVAYGTRTCRADPQAGRRVQAKFNDDSTRRHPTPSCDAAEAMAQGEVDRPGQGRRGAGGPARQELQRRRRDAQDRPPAAAGLYISAGRRPSARSVLASRTPATLRAVQTYDAYVASTPTSCQMKRPEVTRRSSRRARASVGAAPRLLAPRPA
jgi:branched-chain amino acid transport system substrate-binding protein